METAYVLVKSQVAHEMDVMGELLKIDNVKEARGTFGVYDIFVKVEAKTSKELEDTITKNIRKVKHVISTTTLSVIPEQDKN
ncbi:MULTISPECIES: Lrp/AsnC ligand binding domain-containing protein [Nitrosarchaeum]|jgi:DNA-binding Lrp family transcriptional regulator|uniref:Transcriptional regulator n=1 Tax=Nitrosarchaeum koreense MY1 TaxID=1001994 RepID=F9CWH6_9ARCH|nr:MULTISPECIES: Lrp/AsnC ligand binding domain-containing protein [Nitrosarchaeum]EGP93628.1 Transcriptional regulator [Nitrosarchaeum koreense MY1]QLH10937.1 Lrp/AsnC family transcriptional regulator [Nitrosarchaeum sp. AC2]